MTAVLEPVTANVVAADPSCPPWCVGALGHDSTDGYRYHAGREVAVPLGAPDVTAAVQACRDDDDIERGEPYVYLCGDGPNRKVDDWHASLTPAAAVQLGQALIAAGMEAAGLPRPLVSS